MQPVNLDQNAEIDLENPSYFINRELSLLEFQVRVLEEAEDPRNPLLERIKFMSIVGSNLDEFFMVRVAGLKQQIDAGVHDISPDGLTPSAQLVAVRNLALRIIERSRKCLVEELLPALQKAGVYVLEYGNLNQDQKAEVDRYFQETVFPVLDPPGI